MPLSYCNVSLLLSPNYHILSLRVASSNGQAYIGNQDVEKMEFKIVENLLFPLVERLNFLMCVSPRYTR